MYECPIVITTMRDFAEEQMVERDNAIVVKIQEKIGIDVDKEELIKALNYDRHQYEKGHAEGYAAARADFAPKWTKVGDELPEESDFYHVVMRSKDKLYEYRYETGYFDAHIKCWYIGKHTYSQNMVIAWMPIPKYEGVSE